MLEELLKQDKALFLLLNNLGTKTWDPFWLVVTNKYSSIPIYLILIFLAHKVLGWKRTVVLVFFAIIMIVCTNGLADFFKYGVQRLRPCYDVTVQTAMRLVNDSCGGKFGFFSAHAGNTMAIAVYFSILLKSKWRFMGVLLLVWSVLIAYSRIYLGVHFPIDVFTGMAIGLFFGWVFAKLFIFGLSKMRL